jgi:hypothetical protein
VNQGTASRCINWAFAPLGTRRSQKTISRGPNPHGDPTTDRLDGIFDE